MTRKLTLIILLNLLCVFAAIAQTTAFTYQGKLTDNALPATASYDFEFRLFDTSGNQLPVGTPLTLTKTSVAVASGIFTVSLDFGNQFDGMSRFLDISVRPTLVGGAYTPLTPRQPISSSPYSVKSLTAANADNALNLGGQPPSAFGTSAQIATLQTQITGLQTQNTTLQMQITQLQADLVAGTQLWSKGMGSTGDDRGYSIAVDGSGNVFVAGYFNGMVDFGGGLLTSAGGNDIFVAKYSGTTGAHLWSKRFGGTLTDFAQGLTVDGSGNVFLTGAFVSATIDFGGPVLTNAGNLDIFLAKLSGSNGAHLWSRRFGSTSNEIGYGVAVTLGGDVYMTGIFNGTVDFGGLPLTSSAFDDIFVAKYSGTTSSHIWSKSFGGTSNDLGRAVATDSSGNVFVTGSYSSTSINFGGGALTNLGLNEGYLAKLASADGSHLWSKRFGNTGNEFSNGVAVDASGSAFVTGAFGSTTIDFGGGPLTNLGVGNDVFLAKYNSSGTHQWSKAFGGTSEDVAYSIALDGGGNPLVTGYFSGTTNFGGTSLNSAGFSDIFAAKYLGSDGSHQWSRRFGGTNDDFGQSIAVDSTGNVFLTGFFQSPTLDFGGGPLTQAGSFDIFAAKLKK